jgi:Capsule assembly protein Wzi/PAP2 superfamily
MLVAGMITTIGLMGSTAAFGQQPDTPQPHPDPVHNVARPSASSFAFDPEPTFTAQHSIKQFPRDLLLDQKSIWLSPAKLSFSDTQWLFPMGGIAAGMFVTDSQWNGHLSHSPSTISSYKNLSDAAVGALIGGAGGLWVFSHFNHREHWRETGWLAGEAAINSLLVSESLKYAFGRERPYQGDGSGPFFSGGTSFPSEHAAAAWSVAGVVAHEYPGILTKIIAYGLAATVDYSRVHGQQHFPSDVFVGSILGNLVAQNIYSRHHDPQLGGDNWNSLSTIFKRDGHFDAANHGSPYVPLDSWVYPAMDRLIAEGFIRSAIVGMRPWTRQECQRLLGEVSPELGMNSSESEDARVYRTLQTEFQDEIEGKGEDGSVQGRVETVYSRFTEITGTPLTDGYHFGQTISNDFGRPYQQGFNTVDGFSTWATYGRWVAYFRGEYQHSPSAPALSSSARNYIALLDEAPNPPSGAPTPPVNRFQVLDAYVGLTFSNWMFSFGQESLWWGQNNSGPLIFTDNAVPIAMFHIDRVTPFRLPSFLSFLGPVRFQAFMGQLQGQTLIYSVNTGLMGQYGISLGRQPMLNGFRFSFKPTENVEINLSPTFIYGGADLPLNFHTLFRSFSLANGIPGTSEDPADRRSSVDFAWRLPKLRDWVTFHGDAFTEDEPSPLYDPAKSAYQGGIYMPRLPKLHKLDLRLEGGSSIPYNWPTCNGCFYDNQRYRNGYTNDGNLIGSTLGRASNEFSAITTYWFSQRSSLQFQYRHQKLSSWTFTGGGTINDAQTKLDYWLSNSLEFSGSLQYEKWLIPVVTPSAQTNITTSLQFTFWPHASKAFRNTFAWASKENN